MIWLILFGQQIGMTKSVDYPTDYEDEQNTVTSGAAMIEITTDTTDHNEDAMIENTTDTNDDNEEIYRSNNETGVSESDLSSDDIIDLDVGGQKITTRRSTLTAVPNSKLALMFAKDDNNQAEAKSEKDTEVYFLDYNPILFQYLLDQLRTIKRSPQAQAYELHFKAPDVDVPFDYSKMLYELGLNGTLNQIGNTQNSIDSFF